MSWIERHGRFLALGVLALMWPVIADYQRGTLPGPKAGAYGALVAVFVAVYTWYCLFGSSQRNARWAIPTIASLTVIAALLNQISGQVDDNFYLIPIMVAGVSLRPRTAVVAIALVAAVTMLGGIFVVNAPPERAVFQTVVIIPIAILFGGGGMGLRYLLATVTELRAARAEIAQHAADQERARIARDLHDLLGRNLSVITLKGELATRLLPESALGVDEVRDMLGLSREALQQVREVVSGYRQPTLSNELMAAKVALKAAGIEVEVTQSVGALDRASEAALGWVIREATTNVIRHSGAKHCWIVLTRNDGQLQAQVINDGWRVPEALAGNGLRGLGERLSALGGTLEAEPLTSAGFRLVATVPVTKRPNPSEVDVEVAP